MLSSSGVLVKDRLGNQYMTVAARFKLTENNNDMIKKQAKKYLLATAHVTSIQAFRDKQLPVEAWASWVASAIRSPK